MYHNIIIVVEWVFSSLVNQVRVVFGIVDIYKIVVVHVDDDMNLQRSRRRKRRQWSSFRGLLAISQCHEKDWFKKLNKILKLGERKKILEWDKVHSKSVM